jgi:hypothetical protein
MRSRPFGACWRRPTPPVPGLPPFRAASSVYVAYDWGLTLERLPAPRFDDLDLDDVVFGVYDWVLAWDHAASKAWLVSTGLFAETGDRHPPRGGARGRGDGPLGVRVYIHPRCRLRTPPRRRAGRGRRPAGDARPNGSSRPPFTRWRGGW